MFQELSLNHDLKSKCIQNVFYYSEDLIRKRTNSPNYVNFFVKRNPDLWRGGEKLHFVINKDTSIQTSNISPTIKERDLNSTFYKLLIENRLSRRHC